MSTTAIQVSSDRDRSPSEPTSLDDILTKVGTNGEALEITLDLLRRIIELLLPKASDDGPTLTDLLAALLATMRETLIVEKANARGIDEILQRLEAAGIPVPMRNGIAGRNHQG